jgi:hypothetical protein
MEKKLVLHGVAFSPSSIFSKEDVLRIVRSVDENPIKIYQMEPVKEIPMTSLFDYLGRAAGAELGGQVYATAKRLKETVESRIVETKNYRGQVMVYRKAFLEEYFENKQK